MKPTVTSAILAATFLAPAAALAQSKLLLTEVVVSATPAEYVEIYNPTSASVDLTNYYLADFDAYYALVTSTSPTSSTDFLVRFPAGSTIAPASYQTISIAGAQCFFDACATVGMFMGYNVLPTYEITPADASFSNAAVPDMLAPFGGATGTGHNLTNGGEPLVLFFWDGASDRVVDVDYVYVDDGGATNPAVNKNGISIDGPDADALATAFAAEVGDNVANHANHAPLSAPASGTIRTCRVDYTEGTQAVSGGNGIAGRDETSENWSATWAACSTPTPNDGDLDGDTVLDSVRQLPHGREPHPGRRRQRRHRRCVRQRRHGWSWRRRRRGRRRRWCRRCRCRRCRRRRREHWRRRCRRCGRRRRGRRRRRRGRERRRRRRRHGRRRQRRRRRYRRRRCGCRRLERRRHGPERLDERTLEHRRELRRGQPDDRRRRLGRLVQRHVDRRQRLRLPHPGWLRRRAVDRARPPRGRARPLGPPPSSLINPSLQKEARLRLALPARPQGPALAHAAGQRASQERDVSLILGAVRRALGAKKILRHRDEARAHTQKIAASPPVPDGPERGDAVDLRVMSMWTMGPPMRTTPCNCRRARGRGAAPAEPDQGALDSADVRLRPLDKHVDVIRRAWPAGETRRRSRR